MSEDLERRLRERRITAFTDDGNDLIDFSPRAKEVEDALCVEAADALASQRQRIAELEGALLHVEQAYANSHSPQHRSAALAQARAALGARK